MNGTKGRLTHAFLRRVAREIETVRQNVTCMLTGHGPFGLHYKRIGKRTADICVRCGQR